jgi:hypothetical protein
VRSDPDLHRRAADLFADALDREPDDREAAFEDPALDPLVVAEARSLLAAHDAAGDAIAAPDA